MRSPHWPANCSPSCAAAALCRADLPARVHLRGNISRMQLRSIRDAEVAGKTVLVRLDLNVPLDDEGHVTDATRISASIGTLAWLLEAGANLVLCSHLGRPDGVDEKLRLSDVAN